MEENYKLEKEYTIPYDLFREAYRDFQKIYVFPKSRIKTLLFTIAAIVMIVLRSTVFENVSAYAVYICYLLFVVFVALAIKSWYDPNKIRDNLVKSVQALGEPVYKIGTGDGYIDISTVSDDPSNDVVYEEGEEPEDITDDPLPDKTRINVDGNFSLHEYEKYFLIVPDSSVLYILPKKNFSGSELDILRNIKK